MKRRYHLRKNKYSDETLEEIFAVTEITPPQKQFMQLTFPHDFNFRTPIFSFTSAKIPKSMQTLLTSYFSHKPP